jgi:hypothetical protein
MSSLLIPSTKGRHKWKALEAKLDDVDCTVGREDKPKHLGHFHQQLVNQSLLSISFPQPTIDLALKHEK